MRQIVSGLAMMVIIGCLTPLQSSAGDDLHKVPFRQGKLWYDKYCTSCHGPGGAPGSAVFAATHKPVDLRTIAQRNGGKFPSMKWWNFVFRSEPRGVHAEAWQRIRDDQTETVQVERDVAAHGVAANIEHYVESIQNPKK